MVAEVPAEEPEEADRVGHDPDQDRRLCRLAAVTKDLRDNPTSPSGKYFPHNPSQSQKIEQDTNWLIRLMQSAGG